MKVLSLFDGISCGQVALQRAGIIYDEYYASEIDRNAIEVTQTNFPNTIQLGDVKSWKDWKLPEIDLLIGGSPCQGFSKGGKGLNFDDSRSKLFFEFVAILKTLKPKIFLLENVHMKKEWLDTISQYLEVEPVFINSRLVSAQNRQRAYWTNLPDIDIPIDKCITLDSILDTSNDLKSEYLLSLDYFDNVEIERKISENRTTWKIPEATKLGYTEVSTGQCVDLTFIASKTRRGRSMVEKSNCLTASSQKLCKVTKDWFRVLTPVECERLQTLPDNYTDMIPNSQRYKCLGNGWTVDVIAHIFSYMNQ